jgi:hypothetical protein
MVAGTRDDAVALREEAAQVLARIGLRLSEEKTLITHIDGGLDFLGWRIQRHRKRGTNQHYVYTYPARKALRAAMAKVRMWCRRVDTNQPLDVLLARINPLLKGWTAFFRPGVSSATFQYLAATGRGGRPRVRQVILVLLKCPSKIHDDLLVFAAGCEGLAGQSPVPEKNSSLLQALGLTWSKPGRGDQPARRHFTQDMPAAEQVREPASVGQLVQGGECTLQGLAVLSRDKLGVSAADRSPVLVMLAHDPGILIVSQPSAVQSIEIQP